MVDSVPINRGYARHENINLFKFLVANSLKIDYALLRNNMSLRYLVYASLLTLFAFMFNSAGLAVAADSSQGVAIDIKIEDGSVPDGSIISLNDGKYRLSTIPYDGAVYGIVTENPAVAFKDLDSTDKHSIITQGRALLRVSTKNGLIKSGDLITTSTIPGVGQKVTENGYVVAIAEQDYLETDPQRVGVIYSTLHLNFGTLSSGIRENLISSLLQGARAPFSSPVNALRYIMAGLVAFCSFGGGFLFFGKISSRGVEAVGRNPLARRFILLSVMFNVILTLGVMGFGVALAYIILVI